MAYKHDIKWATKGAFWNLEDIQINYLVLHSVGVGQPSADVFERQFNVSPFRASVGGWIEPGRFLETAPVFKTPGFAKKCYHVGTHPTTRQSYNGSSIGIEMTEPATIKYTGGATFADKDPVKTKQFIRDVTATAIDVFSDLCIFHNLPSSRITTHAESYRRGYGSGHADPEHLWNYLGDYSINQFRADVQTMIEAKKGDILSKMTIEEFNQILDGKMANIVQTVLELDKKVQVVKDSILPAPDLYKTIEEVPEWGKSAVEKAFEKGIIVGTGVDPETELPILNLNYNDVRTLVIMNRLALFNQKRDSED
ncbi:N-acetylmuramoyl-L-alanine amidase [Massilibacteroides sp.]|uniref:N-acetylmuramoyl-L-alanine amidase n=1 Tax=Massilibacteroides sp. TaxID=2034766 RepID=UPI002619E668|nr:N-acetylmuramoyl-L-alanine amidase [Massilibacteroides sp.]MDD4516345.1 N-acetylmuramoyl-L-alanine amidase [Massilibacteroides sp.]